MRPKEILESFSKTVTVRPGLSNTEIARFQEQLPGPLPPDIAGLLVYSAGFDADLGGQLDSRDRVTGPAEVLFTGTGDVALPSVLPCPIALLGDGFGNFWVVDVHPNGVWGAVVFLCHDPPVVVIQAGDIASFLDQILNPEGSDPKYALKYVRNAATTEIWKHDPWLLSAKDGQSAQDPLLSAFASQLPDHFKIADLRSAQTGCGFSWGKAGSVSDIRRSGTELLFGIEPKRPGPFHKLFAGRASDS